MTFDELCDEGRKLARNPEKLRAELRPLATDPRFAALVGLVENARDAYRGAAEAPGSVQNHAGLAHTQGSAYALTCFLDECRAMWESKEES